MNIERTFWYEMVYGQSEKIETKIENKIIKENPRDLRQAWLDKLTNK
jgi:hypothetical protein